MSHLPVSAYTSITLEWRILRFQAASSVSLILSQLGLQAASRKGLSQENYYFFPSLLSDQQISKGANVFLNGFTDLCKKSLILLFGATLVGRWL